MRIEERKQEDGRLSTGLVQYCIKIYVSNMQSYHLLQNFEKFMMPIFRISIRFPPSIKPLKLFFYYDFFFPYQHFGLVSFYDYFRFFYYRKQIENVWFRMVLFIF